MHASFHRRPGGLLIGAGIQVRPSSLGINSGMGVYLTEDVEVDSVVSVYDGWLVLRALIPRVGEFRNVAQWSHCMTIQPTDFAVIGLRDPVVGRGAGSFVNHCKRLQNVIAVNVTGKIQWDYYGDAAVSGNQGTQLPVLAMVATRDIKAGEELFTCYRPGVCKWMGFDYHSEPVTAAVQDVIVIDVADVNEAAGENNSQPAEADFDVQSSISLSEFLAGQGLPRSLPLDGINSTVDVDVVEVPRSDPVVPADIEIPTSTEIPHVIPRSTADEGRLLGEAVQQMHKVCSITAQCIIIMDNLISCAGGIVDVVEPH